MASPLSCKVSHCLPCVRRMPCLGDSLRLPSGQQIRGKKKLAKVTTINVKLRTNIAGFGRKGSIVPVPAGTMRNTWFPRKMAEYQTVAQLKDLGDVVIERDSTFNPREMERLAQERREAQKPRREDSLMALETPDLQEIFAAPIEEPVVLEPEAEFEMLSPEEAAVIVSKLAPANLEFYRTVMPAPPPPKRLSPSLASSSAALAAAAAAVATGKTKQDSQRPTGSAIYGSISTADIAATLKTLLWDDMDGSRVELASENISFAEESTLEDKDRVKHLGSYEIDIRLGPSETERVRRTITVRAQQ